MIFIPEEIQLVQTCPECPEQYNAYIFRDQQVGYLRMRHGRFTVQYPNALGRKIYTARPTGDGCFTDAERQFYLAAAKRHLIRSVARETANTK